MFKQNLSQDQTPYRTQYLINSYQTTDYSKRTQTISSSSKNLKKNPVLTSFTQLKNNLNYNRFLEEVSKLDFFPINCNQNFPGNYDNYLTKTLSHIAKMKNIKFNYALGLPSLNENFPKEKIERISVGNTKILLLDLDETLIHADFREEYINNENHKYDATISFYTNYENDEIPNIENDINSNIEEMMNNDLSNNKILCSVGIFLRPGVQKFLAEISKNFEVGIFTAASPEYADAAINYLDPEDKYIKFRLYRNHCINLGDSFRVKDLRILKNLNIKNIILVDNNMYSFAPQLNNGILINSFYCDKDDKELDNVYNYLIDYILPTDDVRKVNEKFFGFKKILNEMITN